MTILSRYIARHFAMNIVILLVMLWCLIVSVDATLNIHRFINAAERRASEGATLPRPLLTAYLIFDLWWPRLLQLTGFMLGVVMVGAMGFTCSQMVRHREFVAILASGQSLRRVARPILAVALVLTGLQAANQELVIPRIAPLLAREHQDAGRPAARRSGTLMVADGAGRIFLVGDFDADTGQIRDAYVWERDDRRLATRRIHADVGTFRNGGWDLTGGVAETPVSGQAMPAVEPVSRIDTGLNPSVFSIAQATTFASSLSFRQLSRMIETVDASQDRDDAGVANRRERLDRIRWSRFSIMTANLIGLVIALPYYLCRVPTKMIVQTVRCAPVALGSIMGAIIASNVPVPGVPAIAGVFVPVLVLLPMAAGMVLRIRT
ncbi:MAG: LptF/LptG family permease [Phycisphaeraceae bacterium]|nr:LptF/LptG family permease [Phycisphaeraceae bacterium]